MTNFIKEKLNPLKQWAEKRPKQIYIIGCCLLVASFGYNLINDIFFPAQEEEISFFSSQNYKNTPSKLDKIKGDRYLIENKMEKIVRELEMFQVKYQAQKLNKKDSLRIEFLYNQYTQLKNEL